MESRRAGESRVLVLDADQPAALAIVRSLGRSGSIVDVGERCDPSLSSRSRFANASFRYADPLSEPDVFASDVLDRVRAYSYELVIPVTDDTVHPLSKRRTEFERHTRLAIAPASALEVMCDKAKTLELAESLGIATPRSLRFDTLAELEHAAPTLRYPVVVKPARSIADRTHDVRAKLTVSYAMDAADLVRRARGPIAVTPVIVQEYCRGKGIGVEILCDDGEVVSSFQHEREHEMPLTGGGSCLRRSVPVDPVLLDASAKLLRAVRWHGVAMVEFKRDPASGRTWLMEVNGRFWGSLPLAVAAGADFPKELRDLLVHGRRPAGNRASRIGVRCRKLGFDVFWTIEVLRRTDPSPLIEWPSRLGALLDWFTVFSPRHYFDVQSFRDPVPGLVDASNLFGAVMSRVRDRFRKRSFLRAMARERDRRDELKAKVERSRRILFLCWGNINRSVVAEHLARTLLGHDAKIEFRSCGFHPRAGRPIDSKMRAVAERRGARLEDSGSRRVTRDDVAGADLVFVMEAVHFVHLLDLAPEAAGKAHLLGTLTIDPDCPLEIADPYGRDVEVYERCFDEISSCITGLGRMRGTVVVDEGVRA